MAGLVRACISALAHGHARRIVGSNKVLQFLTKRKVMSYLLREIKKFPCFRVSRCAIDCTLYVCVLSIFIRKQFLRRIVLCASYYAPLRPQIDSPVVVERGTKRDTENGTFVSRPAVRRETQAARASETCSAARARTHTHTHPYVRVASRTRPRMKIAYTKMVFRGR